MGNKKRRTASRYPLDVNGDIIGSHATAHELFSKTGNGLYAWAEYRNARKIGLTPIPDYVLKYFDRCAERLVPPVLHVHTSLDGSVAVAIERPAGTRPTLEKVFAIETRSWRKAKLLMRDRLTAGCVLHLVELDPQVDSVAAAVKIVAESFMLTEDRVLTIYNKLKPKLPRKKPVTK
jgi:hypothetical protein